MKNFNEELKDIFEFTFIRDLKNGRHPGTVMARHAIVKLFNQKEYATFQDFKKDVEKLQDDFLKKSDTELTYLGKVSNERASGECEGVLEYLKTVLG